MPTSIITRGSGVSIAGRQSRGLSPAFSRASAAYQSDGRKVGVGVPRFETVDGRRGVLVEEGTVNLVANPAFVQGLEGWTRNQDVTLDHVVSEDKSWCKVTSDQASSTPGVLSSWIPVSANATYTVSLVGFVGQGTTPVYVYVNGNVTSNVVWSCPSSRLGASPSRKVETFNTGDNTKVRVGALWSGVAIGDWFEITEAQLEAKPYATSFVDGARLEERLTIQEGSMSPHGGSIAVRARANVRTGTYQPPFDGRWSFSLPLGLLITGTVVACYYTDPQGTSFSYDTGLRVDDITAWNHYAVTYDGASVVPYLNGVSGVPKAAVIGTNRSDPLRLGVTVGGAFFNGVLSGLSIFRRCLTSSEIAAHMAGDIPSDCYYYPFDGDLWPAPGSLGAVVAPAVTTRSGRVDVVTRRGSVDIITRPGKLEVIGR